MTRYGKTQVLGSRAIRAARALFFGHAHAQDMLAFSIASYGGIGVAGTVTALTYLRIGLWGGGPGEIALFAACYAATTALLALMLRAALNPG